MDQDPILLERARALAEAPTDETSDDRDTIGLVIVSVHPERYAVEITSVLEIEHLRGVTPLPGLRPWWTGLVNLRGSMYPVLDLRIYLGLPQGPDGGPKRLALVAHGDLKVGLAVDDVPELRRIRLEDLRPPVAESETTRVGALRGVTPDMLSVLDVAALLDDPRLVEDSN